MKDMDTFQVESVDKKCIQIRLSADLSIFKNETHLFWAIQSLTAKVVDAANLSSDAIDVIDMSFVFDGPLSEGKYMVLYH